jgi:hypothetical protein
MEMKGARNQGDRSAIDHRVGVRFLSGTLVCG